MIKNDFQKLEIRNINFKYKSSNKITLKNINLEIFKNDFVGIIGSSGAGKSSLIDLILGFLEQDNGQINAYSKNNVLIENRDHPWFVGVQSHPEYKSSVYNPHPIFVNFVKASLKKYLNK